MNVARQVSINAMMATGMTMVVITGGTDLSVGSVATLAGCVCAKLMLSNSIAFSMTVALLIGCLCGMLNGLAITKGKTPPFVATLGMLTVARGAVLLYTNGNIIPGLPEKFVNIGRGWAFGGKVPIPVMFALGIMLLGHFILSSTSFGMRIYSVGGNAEAAKLSGINVERTRIIVYALSGIFAALAGLVLTARVFSGQPTLGAGMELQAVAATLIGGTTMGGGEGNMLGTLMGVLIMGVLTNGLNLTGVSSYWQDVVTGTVIVLAVILYNLRKNK